MNSKGQVPVLMLVVVAIVLVIVVLVSFVTFKAQFGDESASVSKTIAKVQFGEGYVIESAKSIARETIAVEGSRNKFASIAGEKDFGVPESGNFFAKIRNKNFTFENTNPGYKLNMTDLFVQVSQGNNQITRKFDLCMLFDSSGNYIPPRYNDLTEREYADKCGKRFIQA